MNGSGPDPSANRIELSIGGKTRAFGAQGPNALPGSTDGEWPARAWIAVVGRESHGADRHEPLNAPLLGRQNAG